MKENRVIAGFGWSFAERMSAQIVSFIVSVILARLLSPEEYGILGLVNVFIVVGDALVASGFGTALVQKKDSCKEDYDTMCWLSIGTSTLIYAVLFISAPYIAQFYNNAELTLITRVYGIRFIFSAVNSIQQAYIQKQMLFRLNCGLTTVSSIVSGVVGIWIAVKGFGVWALIGQSLCMVIASTIALFFFIDWRPTFAWSMKSIKNLWKYGTKVFLATLVDTLKDNIRSLVIGKVFSSTELAYYNQGKRFPQLLVNDVVNSVGKVLFPVFSSQQDDKEKNKKLMRISIRISSFILLPMIFGLVGIAESFIGLILTEKWLPCVPYLQILCLMYATRSVNTIFKNSLLAIGRSGVNLFHEIITSVVTVALIVIAACVYKDVELIAWSYVIVSLLGTVIFSYYTAKEYCYSVRQMIRDYAPSLCLALIMMCVVMLLGELNILLFPKLLLQVVSGCMVYIGLAIMFKLDEWKYLWSFILNRLIHRS